jgi:hypothetical protein
LDQIEPVSGRGEMDHAGEAIRELIFSGCDDFLMSGRSLDAISLLV